MLYRLDEDYYGAPGLDMESDPAIAAEQKSRKLGPRHHTAPSISVRTTDGHSSMNGSHGIVGEVITAGEVGVDLTGMRQRAKGIGTEEKTHNDKEEEQPLQVKWVPNVIQVVGNLHDYI